MLDRSNYSLADFLLFSDRVYFRMFELHNATLWPLHVIAICVGLFMVFSIVYPSPMRHRIMLAILALSWAFIAWTFLINRYAAINWAALYIAPVFMVQAALLGVLAIWQRCVDHDRGLSTSKRVGLGVLVFALFGYPLVNVLLGRRWDGVEIFAIAPDPTVVATLAILATFGGMAGLVASVIPLLWVILTSLTLWTLGSLDFLVAPIAAIVCAGTYFVRR